MDTNSEEGYKNSKICGLVTTVHKGLTHPVRRPLFISGEPFSPLNPQTGELLPETRADHWPSDNVLTSSATSATDQIELFDRISHSADTIFVLSWAVHHSYTGSMPNM